MSRSLAIFSVLLGIVIGGGAVWALRPIPPALDADAVRAIVADAFAQRDAAAPAPAAPMETADLGPSIENYLMANPRLLQRVSDALQTQIDTENRDKTATQIAALRTQIYDDPDHIVLGNPDGDVTLVEMFDYNCTYCRGALPDLATLLAEDPELKVVLKEFPILTEGSLEAAQVAVQVAKAPVDYWTFHQALFSSRGEVTGETALAEAATLGLNPFKLEAMMGTTPVAAVIQKSYDLADALEITGTPTYIIGDELIPGAIGLDALKQRIANMRACGKTECAQAG